MDLTAPPEHDSPKIDRAHREFNREGFRRRLAEMATDMGSVNALAKQARVSQSSLRGFLERGDAPGRAVWALAEAAGVQPEWLMTGKGPKDSPRHLQAHPDLLVEAPQNVVFVPECEVAASAGHGAEVGEREVDKLVGFNRKWIRAYLKCDPDQLCLVHIQGDSMEPTLSDGDMVLVDRSDTRPREGIFAINLDGLFYVKRLQPLNRQHIQILSDNDRCYPARTVSAGDLGQELRLIGRVVWADRRF